MLQCRESAVLVQSVLRARKAIKDNLHRGNPWKNSGGDTFHGTQWKNHSKSESQVKFSEILNGFNGFNLMCHIDKSVLPSLSTVKLIISF